MAELGDILDAIEAAAEGAVTGLTVERGLRLEVHEDEAPILFLYNVEETVEIGDHLQETVQSQVTGALATYDDQAAALTKLDQIRDAIRADSTLGGLVQWALVSARGLDETFDETMVWGTFTFTTQDED